MLYLMPQLNLINDYNATAYNDVIDNNNIIPRDFTVPRDRQSKIKKKN